MPPKLNPETPKQQYARFKREAQKLIDAGELDPIEADAAFERLLKRIADDREGADGISQDRR